MRFTGIFIISVFLIISTSAAQAPDTLWTNTFGGSSLDRCFSGISTSDGGYLLGGLTKSYGAGNEDLWVVKTNSNGTFEWYKVFGGTSVERAYSVIETSDGYFLAAGATHSFGAGEYDGWVIKLDSSGNLVWKNTYGGIEEDAFTCIDEVTDGNYVVSGYTCSYSGDEPEAWLLKIDTSGNVIWEKTYTAAGFGCSARGFTQTSDDGYAFTGKRIDSSGDPDIWIVKTDSNGNIVWESTSGGSEVDNAWRIAETPDGGFIVVGKTESFGAGNTDLWLLKTDNTCVVEWDMLYGAESTDAGTGVLVMPDSGFVVTGYALLDGGEYPDALALRTDKNGTIKWEFILGESGLNVFYDIDLLPDLSYALFGYTSDWGAGSSDFWLVKTTPDLTGIEGEFTILRAIQLLVEPNPFTSSLEITYDLPAASDVHLDIFDISGRLVANLGNVLETAGIHTILWDAEHLPIGCYQVIIQVDDVQVSRRCIKLY